MTDETKASVATRVAELEEARDGLETVITALADTLIGTGVSAERFTGVLTAVAKTCETEGKPIAARWIEDVTERVLWPERPRWTNAHPDQRTDRGPEPRRPARSKKAGDAP